MIDHIVQEVRDIRASIAEQFGFDRTLIIAWAREQTAARKAALREPKANQTLETNGGASTSPSPPKRRSRPSGLSS